MSDVAHRLILRGLRPSQLEVINDPHRIKVVACGRKWGKTTTAMFFMVKYNFELGKNKILWWIMPSYTQCRDVQKGFVMLFKEAGIVKRAPKRPEYAIVFSNGGVMTFKSADKPDYLRGPNPHIVVVDEARDITDEAWYEVIRPNLAGRKAQTLIISTPRKNHWFETEFLRGVNEEAETKSWNYPSWDNPYMVDESEL